LKLGKLTDDLLDEIYDDIMRKFNTYRALDSVEQATPIIAYPILSEEGGKAANKRISQATDKLYELVGYTDGAIDKLETVPIPDELVRAIFEQEMGSPMIDIEDIMRNR